MLVVNMPKLLLEVLHDASGHTINKFKCMSLDSKPSPFFLPCVSLLLFDLSPCFFFAITTPRTVIGTYLVFNKDALND